MFGRSEKRKVNFKALRRTLIGLAVVLIVFATLSIRKNLRWSRFVKKVKSSANPVEVQQWAMELIRENGNEYYFDPTGTNFPAGIRNVMNVRADVVTFPELGAVCIAWGRGEPFIFVGSPAFVYTNRPGEMWIQGVYLCKPSE